MRYLVEPQPYCRSAAFVTLVEKEILRFRKIAVQTILAPVLMGLLYMMVFGQVMDGKMPGQAGVGYQSFLVPGLVMMTLLQGAFANSSASLLQAKLMGNLIFVQLPPFSGWQLSLSFIGAAVLRGLIAGAGVLAASAFFCLPRFDHPIWILGFGILGSALMASLGVICGLWAEKFDQMGAFQSFVIMPLTFLSGVFYSIQDLPSLWGFLSRFNPFFYIIDGFRYGFFSSADFNPWVSLAVVAAASFLSTALATALLVRGYKIRK